MANQKDPVCGMNVEQNQHSTQHHGKEYKFCSKECQEKFKKNPEQYSKK
ncbi:YHS domain protein [Candidatus Rubidus massiliensis]|nr:YHS domain protein [Candidatus Rubidus massiliensis]